MHTDKTVLSRRRVIKGSTITAGAVALAGVSAWYGSQPAIAAHVDQWTASDTDTVQSDNGEVFAVWTEPTVEIEWDNFTAGADSVDVTLNAYLPARTNDHIDSNKMDVIFDQPAIVDTSTTGVVGIEEVEDVHAGGFETVNGGVRITLDAFDITNGGDINESDFSDDSSDTANQVTEVDLELPSPRPAGPSGTRCAPRTSACGAYVGRDGRPSSPFESTRYSTAIAPRRLSTRTVL